MRRCPNLLFALAILASAIAPPAPARAQTTEYRLDDSGRWVLVPAPQPGSDSPDAALIAKARRDLADERFGDARSALDDWIKTNERSGNPLLAQAYLLRGDALTGLGDEYAALFDYEALCAQFPGSEEYSTAIQRELEIGIRYVNGYKRRILFARVLGAEDIGQEILIRVQERQPDSRLAEVAGIKLADFYFRDGDMEMAAEAYKLFILKYPHSEYRPIAMQRRIYATISRFKGPRYDNTPLVDATVLTKQFSSLYPAAAQSAGLDDALLARLDESAAIGMLETARWYQRVSDSVSCRYTLRRLVDQYPRTSAAGAALRTMTENHWIDLAPSAPAEPPAAAPATPTLPTAPERARFIPGRRLNQPPFQHPPEPAPPTTPSP